MEKTYKDMEKVLLDEYKKKLTELKKVRAEKESVGQVFTKGILPLYVYYILSLGPANGNDIANQIETHTNGRWCPSTGGIYPILKRMEKEGFAVGVISNEGRLQKIYALTDEGEAEYLKKKDLLHDKIFEALDVFKIISREIYNEIG